jgi:hypothetical protein
MLREFTTLIALLSTFRQERGAEKNLDHQKFIEWLVFHRHDELKNLVVSTHFLSREIDDLLRRDQQEILQQLKSLNEVYASLLSRLDGFAGLVAAMAPGVQISDQAREILVVFAGVNAKFILPKGMSGEKVLFLMGTNQQINVTEPRFVEDDLNTLVQFGFLAKDFTSDGSPIYKLTRNGAKYAEIIKSQKEAQNKTNL